MLNILARGPGWAVIDKPAGLPVEADGAECVVKFAARELGPPGGRAWPRVVHRLDRDTSGCLVLALNNAAEKALLEAFERGEVRKEYVAIVKGVPGEDLKLDTPYGKDPRDARRYTTKLETARRARLQAHVAQRFPDAALLRVFLETGRTHQIRVQLAESGFPVLGDATYGVPFEGLSRQALHAARLTFPGGEAEAPLPDDLRSALERLARQP